VASPDRAAPTLMLFSVVDDRSGVAYQEYRCAYGEDVESGLRFLFLISFSLPNRASAICTRSPPEAERCCQCRSASSGVKNVAISCLGLVSVLPGAPLYRRQLCERTSSVQIIGHTRSPRVRRVLDYRGPFPEKLRVESQTWA
jgi:hypothetical protein